MGSETYHEPLELLSERTRNLHRGLTSLIEELEAIDWYQQRAEACSDGQLKRVLLHNRDEEVEHAVMTLEWLRRNDEVFAAKLREILFTDRDIAALEDGEANDPTPGTVPGSLVIGSLKAVV
jgi:ferritin-like protein